MLHHHKALTAILVGAVLSVAAPAAVFAADGLTKTGPATTTPINTNLLQNAGFEQVPSGGVIPSWTKTGTAHVETFGTRPWPTKAYARTWGGGKRYLTCGTTSGSVSQTVSFSGYTSAMLVRLNTNVGGVTGHKIRVTITVTGDSGVLYTNNKVRVLNVTHHYVKDVVTAEVPVGAKHITATLTLLPKAGAAKCKVVADTVDMWVFPPS